MEVTGTSFSEKIVISSVLFLLTVTYLVQGSHSFGRKNPGLFQEISSPILEFLQELSVIVRSRNIQNKLTRHSSLAFTFHSFVTRINLYTRYSRYHVKTSVNRPIIPKISGLTKNSRSFPVVFQVSGNPVVGVSMMLFFHCL